MLEQAEAAEAACESPSPGGLYYIYRVVEVGADCVAYEPGPGLEGSVVYIPTRNIMFIHDRRSQASTATDAIR